MTTNSIPTEVYSQLPRKRLTVERCLRHKAPAVNMKHERLRGSVEFEILAAGEGRLAADWLKKIALDSPLSNNPGPNLQIAFVVVLQANCPLIFAQEEGLVSQLLLRTIHGVRKCKFLRDSDRREHLLSTQGKARLFID